MVFILLATENVEGGAKIRESLGAQGWWVTVVGDREGALRAAADQAPEVVIVDGVASGAGELVRLFSSGNGGPGVLVLAPPGEHERLSLVEAGADEVLSAAPPARELVQAVERIAAAPHRTHQPGPMAGGKQLSSEEIFGDILAEVDSDAGLESAGPEGAAAGLDDVAAVSPGASPEGEASSGSPSVEALEAGLPEPVATLPPLLTDVPGEIPENPPVVPSLEATPGELLSSEEHGSSLAPEPTVDAADEVVAAESADQSEREAGAAEDMVEAPQEEWDPLDGLEFPRVEQESSQEQAEIVAAAALKSSHELPQPGIAPTQEESAVSVGDEPEEASGSTGAEHDLLEVPSGSAGGMFDLESEASNRADRQIVGGEAENGLFGQYRLEERIAVGGMAEVWRASMEGLEGFRKTVAIKKILPHLAENDDFVAMFIDEAKLAAQLSHENLVDIYDLGKIDGDFFIAMEYVDGKDLRAILNRLRQRREAMPLGLAVHIAARISSALDYAHARLDDDGNPLGLVHRDVSPRNILISRNGHVRLCDFGVAKAVSSVVRTEIGALKGKIQYMSPEQAAGSAVDGRSDVYSLGAVLFEMATDRRLFVGETEINLLDAVRSGDVDDPRSVNPALPERINDVLLKALAKDVQNRYQAAGEMQVDLDETLFGLDPKPTQGSLARWLEDLFGEQEERLDDAPGDALVVDDLVSPPLQPPVEPPLEAAVARDLLPPASGLGEALDPVTAKPEEGSSSRSGEPQDHMPAAVADGSRFALAGGVAEEAASPVFGVTGETESAAADEPKSAGLRFWLGVAVGVVAALVLAWMLAIWLDGRRQMDMLSSLGAQGAGTLVAQQIEPGKSIDQPLDGAARRSSEAAFDTPVSVRQ